MLLKELLSDRLSILHRPIAVREMRLHQIGALDRFFLCLLRCFDVGLLPRELQHLAGERRRQD